MSSDETPRSAAKVATLVALPVALVAGVIAFVVLANVLGGGNDTGSGDPSTGPTAPVATGPVEMTQRELNLADAAACRLLLAEVPGAVRELAQRPVTAGAEQNAAYGDPPITLECGVPEADFDPTDKVWPLDGVCWHADEQPDRSVWVTLDREVPIRVTVPPTYGGPGQWAAEFSPAIVSSVLSVDDVPDGCT